MSENKQVAECPELETLAQLKDYFANKGEKPDLVSKIDSFLVTANKINEGLNEYSKNQAEVATIANEINNLRQQISREESLRKFAVSSAQNKFYQDSLQPSLVALEKMLNDFEPKFADDESLKANFEGIALIFKTFENNLVSLGLHTKVEPIVDSEVAAEIEKQTEEA